MDLTEDMTVRGVFQRILTTEPQRTPVTRSVSREQSSTLRRTTRSRTKDKPPQDPQDIIRRSMRKNLRESISRQSLPPTKRATAALLKNSKLAASSSMSLCEGETPKHIFMNILQTEPVKSPVVHEEVAPMEPQMPSADSSFARKRPSMELSAMELPNLTFDMGASMVEGLKRKRPRRSFSVTAFEERLKEDDAEDEKDDMVQDDLSLSLSNVTSLTPFADDQTEKIGLRRRVSPRRKITEHEFADAVNRRHLDRGASSFVQGEPGLSETAPLALSKFGKQEGDAAGLEPQEVNNTEEEADSRAVGSQNKEGGTESSPEEENAAMASEDELASSQSEGVMENVVSGSQSEENDVAEDENVGTRQQQQEESGEADDDEEEAENQDTEYVKLRSSRFEGVVDSQTEEELPTSSQSEENDVDETENVGEQQQEEEEEEDDDDDDDEEEEARNQDTEHVTLRSHRSEGVVDSQTEEELAPGSQSEENDVDEDENDGGKEEESGGDDDEEEDERNHGMEHVERRTHRSEGALVVPVAEDETISYERAEVKNKTYQLSESYGLETGPDAASPSPAQEGTSGATNSFHLPEMSDHEEDPQQLQEEELEEEDWDDEETEMPAFVREKKTFPLPYRTLSTVSKPQASPSAQVAPPAKAKRVRKRKSGASRQRNLAFSKSYLMSTFRHFAKTRVSADVYPVLRDVMEQFLQRMAEDLETYADHAGRKTIEVEDCVLLLKRQRHVNDRVPMEVLIEKYLRMEQRKILIPIATSGNVVVPKMRR